MSESIIVLDANILSSSPFLDSSDWSALHTHSDEWRLRFAVPEVAVMETVNVVRRKWKPEYDRLKGLQKWVNILGQAGELEKILLAAEQRHSKYEDALLGRLTARKIEIVKVPSEADHMEIARRSSDRKAPYTPNGQQPQDHPKDGYRDTLIWLTVLEIADTHPGCDVWFVSDNYSDFGTKSTDKDPRDQQEYPLSWHSELMEELKARGLSDRVFYARGLSRLEQHLQAQFSPVPDTERDELWDAVDPAELDNAFVVALIATEVDPRSAALPLDTESAAVISVTRGSGSLRLSEAAHRAAGTWTAQLSCEVEVGLEITNRQGNVSEETKRLVVIGRVGIDADNGIKTLNIESVEALADDPMRRAWTPTDLEKFRLRTLADLNLGSDLLRAAESFKVDSGLLRAAESFKVDSGLLRAAESFKVDSGLLRAAESFKVAPDALGIRGTFRESLRGGISPADESVNEPGPINDMEKGNGGEEEVRPVDD